jgi:hypothetical protein
MIHAGRKMVLWKMHYQFGKPVVALETTTVRLISKIMKNGRRKKLTPNLHLNSVIIIDNVPYSMYSEVNT